MTAIRRKRGQKLKLFPPCEEKLLRLDSRLPNPRTCLTADELGEIAKSLPTTLADLLLWRDRLDEIVAIARDARRFKREQRASPTSKLETIARAARDAAEALAELDGLATPSLVTITSATEADALGRIFAAEGGTLDEALGRAGPAIDELLVREGTTVDQMLGALFSLERAARQALETEQRRSLPEIALPHPGSPPQDDFDYVVELLADLFEQATGRPVPSLGHPPKGAAAPRPFYSFALTIFKIAVGKKATTAAVIWRAHRDNLVRNI